MKVVVVPTTAGILQILSPSPWYYRGFYPHSHRNTAVIVPIIGVITAVLPPPPIPMSLFNTDTNTVCATADFVQQWVGTKHAVSMQKWRQLA